MKFTAFALLAAVLTGSVSAQNPICSNTLEIDFSDYPDGYLDSTALQDKGIEDIFCVTTSSQECLIQGGKLVVTNKQFEVAVTFTGALYTAGFEVTVDFPQAPLPVNPLTQDGMPAIDVSLKCTPHTEFKVHLGVSYLF